MVSSNNANVRIGIVGVGGMGSSHAHSLKKGEVPGAELSAVCDINPKRLEAFPGIPGYLSADELLAKASLDAVMVATPHYDHVTVGIKALNAGLHVLVEKPVAVHKKDAQRLIGTPRDKNQIFAAMFNQRTDPRYQWLKKQLSEGAFGRVTRVNWIITNWYRTQFYYDQGDWRATWAGEGGGVLLNQCPHQLDLWQWLFGMPASVRAFCQRGRFHDIEVEDDVTAYMEYADGMHGMFITTTGEAPGTNRLEIAADGGRIIVDDLTIRIDRNTTLSSEFTRTCKAPFAVPETICETVTFKHGGAQHIGILKNFVAAIRGEEELIAPAPEGIHSVELSNAMILSGQTRETVNIPMDADAYERNLNALIKNSTFVKTNVSGTISGDMSNSFA